MQGDIPGGRAFKWNALGGAAEWDQVGNNWIADSNGDVRWYQDIEQIHDSNRRDGKLIWGQGQTYSKYDLLGRRIWQRTLPDKFADFSHEIRETTNGTYLLRVGTSDYRRPDGKRVRSIRDHIIEVNEAGDVLDFWDLNQILDPYRGDLLETLGKAAIQLPEGVQKQHERLANELAEGDLPFGDTPGVGTGRNWAHVNAIDYDADDDSIIVSARHQGVAKIGRDKQVKWILASPQGWPETDTQFIYSASVNFLTPEKLTTTVLNEVRRGTQEVLVELKVHSRQPGSVGYRALVIDLAKAF